MKNNPLKIPLIALGILLISLFSATRIIENKNISNYIENISVEVMGAIITLIFIDIYLNKHEKRIAAKREKIVWTILKPLMRNHFSLLFNIYKASAIKRGENFSTVDLRNFFTNDYLQTISFLNVSSKAPIFPDTTWLKYLKAEFSNLNKNYDTILDKYSNNIEPELVEVIENIKNSIFHHHIINTLPMLEELNRRNEQALPKEIFGKLFTIENTIEPYIKNIIKLLYLALDNDLMQDFFEINDGQWRNDIAPSIGSCRND